MTDRIRWLAPLAAGAALAGSTLLALPDLIGRPAEARPGEEAKVTFEMLPSNHMVIEGMLNGKGPYRLIFDLGAPVTLLSGKAAEATGAIPKDAPKSFLFGVRGEGELKTLKLGGLTAEKVPVIVMDHPALKALGGVFGKPLDGIIGYTFWARYRMTLDYQAKTLSFVPVEFQVRNLMKDLPGRLTGPRKAKAVVVAPRGLWGLAVGPPVGGVGSPGVPITAVRASSPAEAAGLKAGDVLTSLDGRWTASVADVYGAAAGVEPGKAADVTVVRDGRELTLTITPREGI